MPQPHQVRNEDIMAGYHEANIPKGVSDNAARSRKNWRN